MKGVKLIALIWFLFLIFVKKSTHSFLRLAPTASGIVTGIVFPERVGAGVYKIKIFNPPLYPVKTSPQVSHLLRFQ